MDRIGEAAHQTEEVVMRLLAISCAAVAALALGSTANAAPVATAPSVATMDAALPVEQVRGGVRFYFGFGAPGFYGYGYGLRRYYYPRYYYGGYPYYYGPRYRYRSYYRPWRGYRAWRRW